MERQKRRQRQHVVGSYKRDRLRDLVTQGLGELGTKKLRYLGNEIGERDNSFSSWIRRSTPIRWNTDYCRKEISSGLGGGGKKY